MPSPLYEIVELADGAIALRPAEGEEEALVTIKLSQSANEFLGDDKIEVVKAMIEAGFEAVAEINESDFSSTSHSADSSTLH